MKNTILLDAMKSVVVIPGPDKTARIELKFMGVAVGEINLTADQFGALVFAGERVFEHHEQTAKREGQGA